MPSNNYKDHFVAEGRHKNFRVIIDCISYTTACRAARQILNDNPEMATANIKNRKGEVIKVVKR